MFKKYQVIEKSKQSLDMVEKDIKNFEKLLEDTRHYITECSDEINLLNKEINRSEKTMESISDYLTILKMKRTLIVNLLPVYGEEFDKALSNGEFKISDNGEFNWHIVDRNGITLKANGLVYKEGVVLRQTVSYPMNKQNNESDMIQKDSVYIINVDNVNFIAENEVAYTIDSVDNTESKLIERRNSSLSIDKIYNVSLTIANDLAAGCGLNEIVYGEPRAQRIEVLKSSEDFSRILLK